MIKQAACYTPKAIQVHFALPKKESKKMPVAVIGAGPVGMAAAAHLVKAGESFVLLEAGPSVGHQVMQWSHVSLFSPWQFNIDKAAKELLEQSGWSAPEDEELPTGRELVERYLQKLAELPQIAPFIKLNTKVVGISRKGLDKMRTGNRSSLPFIIYAEQKDGFIKPIEAKAVIDTSGTWGQPNPVNASGIWTRQEKELEDKISYGIPDISGRDNSKFKGKHVAVAGGGHSAINTILELAEIEDIQISWILRKSNVELAYGGEDDDELQARGELGGRIRRLVDAGQVKVYTPFYIQHIEKNAETISLKGDWKGEHFHLGNINHLFVNAGSRPDFSFLREIRLNIDPATESAAALAPLIDPNIHSCGTVRPHGEKELRQPEKNFYIAGMKSYGRAPTFLMATGYEQVRSIVAYLIGDSEAAERVELELPETGVCNSASTRPAISCC